MAIAHTNCRLAHPCHPASEGTLRRIITALSRSLADDGLSDTVYEALNEVLDGERQLTENEARQIADIFRGAARQLMHTAPQRATYYPTDTMRRLRALHAEWPSPERAVPYVRRFAVTISTALDHMGDEA
ncbi:hypothetical protein ACTWJ8_31780 [Streptomyces sp. SDT5-1]|uniref:hypothetical protein n=1 Tax=Streptomyces sp. SDT5-1 TaxID=3406418 RepID=UPI003FD10BF6